MAKTNFYELLRLINRNRHRSFATSDIVREKKMEHMNHLRKVQNIRGFTQ